MSQHKQRRQEHLRRKQQRDLPRQGAMVRRSDGVQGVITASTLSVDAQGTVVGEVQVMTLSGQFRVPAPEFLAKWFLA